MRKTLLARISLLGLVLACDSPASRVPDRPFYQESTFSPLWIKPGELPKDFHQIPPFTLTNQHHAQITEKEMDDHVTVVNFFFTFCPGICPKLMGNMAIVEAAFAHDPHVLLLSHSVTPDHDTVEKLRAYARKNQIQSPRWHLLTGDRKTIYSLGRTAYFAEEDLGESRSEDDFLHTENILLIDQHRHLRGIYNGLNQSSIQQLIIDARSLLDLD